MNQHTWMLKDYEDMQLSTQLIIREALSRDIEVEILDRRQNHICLRTGQKEEFIKHASKTSIDTLEFMNIVLDKQITRTLLNRNNIATPYGIITSTLKAAHHVLSGKFHYSDFVAKSRRQDGGKGVFLFPGKWDVLTVNEILKKIFETGQDCVIEDFVRGEEFRFLVIDGNVLSVVKRIPANVSGNGKSSIEELIALKNQHHYRGENYLRPLEKIRIDTELKRVLSHQNLTLDFVPPEGSKIWLRYTSNVGQGGDTEDVTERINPFFIEKARSTASTVKGKIVGVDMIIADRIECSTSSYWVLEANHNPVLFIHEYPLHGLGRRVAGKVLDILGF